MLATLLLKVGRHAYEAGIFTPLLRYGPHLLTPYMQAENWEYSKELFTTLVRKQKKK